MEDEADALGRVPRAHGHRHRTELRNAIQRQHELGPIAHQQRHPVTRVHSQSLQALGNAQAGVFQLPPGPALITVHQRLGLRMARRGLMHHRGKPRRAGCEAGDDT